MAFLDAWLRSLGSPPTHLALTPALLLSPGWSGTTDWVLGGEPRGPPLGQPGRSHPSPAKWASTSKFTFLPSLGTLREFGGCSNVQRSYWAIFMVTSEGQHRVVLF